MRTRKQAERENQSNGSLTAISHDAVGKLLKRAKTGSRKRDDHHQGWDIADKLKSGSLRSDVEVAEMNTDEQVVGIKTKEKNLEHEEISEATHSTLLDDTVEGGIFKLINPAVEDEMDDIQWEDGFGHISNSANNHPETLVKGVLEERSSPISNSADKHSETMAKSVTIEFDTTPDSAQKKTIRRASVEEKELAELVHKVHLLCLLGRGRLIDAACNDPLIQASLLSILPAQLLEISKIEKLTAYALAPVVHWFHSNFHTRGANDTKKSFSSALAHALETREGTSEEVAALSVALFRALNLTSRFVSILDVASVKPNTVKSESTCEDASRESKARRGIFGSSTLMVARPDQVSISPVEQSSSGASGNVCETSSKGASRSKNNRLTSNSTQLKDPCDATQKKLASNAPCNDECLTKKSGGSKRKGDFEFEMQMEIALSATAVGLSGSSSNLGEEGRHNHTANFSSLCKRIKAAESGDSSLSSQGISTALGSRKVGAPLYWAEVYCTGENLAGKWVHVDSVNAIIDGEQKVEAAAAVCKTSLRYVVAFAGSGVKDVTRRYCLKWYKIAPQRVDSVWWDAVLAPLKELEQDASHGHGKEGQSNVCDPAQGFCPKDATQRVNKMGEESSMLSPFFATRSSLEDMELETRALTEPLPTNQQAYKNHPLYALERWLTKYQLLHPRGPILGFCSGQPVYPRTCVQALHTKERWLHEGLQIKANELPAKVLKRSKRLNKAQASEADVEEGCKGDTVLYGKWQTEPLCLPHAINGIVPKNDRGQVDAWSEKCLPPGTVHLRLPLVVPVAKRLEIDYAPAMVGFEFRHGRSVPVFDGIVVCAEFNDVILEAYAEQEERRKTEEKKRNEAHAASRWYQLLSSIVTRQRLNNCYVNSSTSQISNSINKVYDNASTQGGASEDNRQFPRCEENISNSKVGISLMEPREEQEHEHKHVFLLDEQTIEEQSFTRTKRCYCGFYIQVEEL